MSILLQFLIISEIYVHLYGIVFLNFKLFGNMKLDDDEKL